MIITHGISFIQKSVTENSKNLGFDPTLNPPSDFLYGTQSLGVFGKYLIPELGHVPRPPFPAGAVGTKSPVCKLPLTLYEYQAWFKTPLEQPKTTALPVMLVNAVWISSEV
jgi:hypothetical protein